MSEIYEVNASGLRLRDRPEDGAVISVLPTGHAVERLAKANVRGWWRVSTRVAGDVLEGFVAAEYLVPAEPRPGMRIPFLSNLDASFDKLRRFAGAIAERYQPADLAAFNEVLTQYGINKNFKRFTHFLAQIAHESAHFTRLEENLNYSGQALWNVFRSHFASLEEAESYARQPERIANRVYADRLGNGPEASGDGYRYRGRGFIQLTGRANYRRIGEKIGVDLESNPDLIAADPVVALKVAAAYWDDRHINDDADRDDIRAVTKKVNGGYNGLKDREKLLARARSIWA